MTYSEQTYVKALRERGKVGPKTFQMLLYHFGSPEAILNTPWEEIAALPRLNEKRAKEILGARDWLEDAALELNALAGDQIRLMTFLEDGYPERLKAISDPPPLLYLKGEFPVPSERFVAVVGTHEATAEGIAAAVQFGKVLAGAGAVVVSGLARGIDAAGHVGALKAGGKCYGVLGSGFGQIYPKEHDSLASEVAKNGALISEYAPGVPVNVGQLMARNRIVVGLASAVIIVELPGPDGAEQNNSGTLNAMERGREQGKPVYLYDPQKHLSAEQLHQWEAQSLIGPEQLSELLPYLI